MKNKYFNPELRQAAEQYLAANLERFDNSEKKLFRKHLQEYSADAGVIYDEVYDFLYHCGMRQAPRWQPLVDYLVANYPAAKYHRVLDVGAGRMAHLTEALSVQGYEVTAMDPKLRLQDHETKNRLIRKEFCCDDFAPNGQGTEITNYDLVVGLEPCLAAEHILRQCAKYQKPSCVVLCYEAHSALNGQQFTEPEHWYNYLWKNIPGVTFDRAEYFFVARNSDQKKIQEAESNLSQ